MRIQLVVVLAASALCFAQAAEAATTNVTVRVNHVRSSKGKIMVEICEKGDFLKGCKLKQAKAAKEGTDVFTFKTERGAYAATVYHDENNNGKMDKNPIGIPKEGYGFSRDAKGRNGPPDFASASFNVANAATTVDINLNY